MFRRTDVQGDTAHITLMYRSYHLRHHRITYLLGKGDEFVFRRAHQFRHQRDTRTGENLAHGLRRHVAIFLDA